MAANEFRSKNKITVHGYMRENFDDNYWINEIIQIIVQFYVSNGKSLYVWGNGAKTENKCKSPILSSNFQNTTLDVSVGCHAHSLVLDIYGDVWTCGNAEYGILENGKVFDSATPQRLNVMETVVGIAAGGDHSLILLKNGYVLSFGKSWTGQLGHGNKENAFIPKVVESLKNKKIVQIAAGYLHSVCLSKKGEVFCFGDNSYGQCGVGEEDEIMIPTKIVFDGSVVSIECGDSITLLIDTSETIYSFGQGDCGKLGHGDEYNRYEPTLIRTLEYEFIVECSSGEYHSICINNDGVCWMFGENDKGQCGLGEEIESQLIPKKIEYFVENSIKAVHCSAGDDHSCIISSDGSLYVFGSNSEYQLGLKETRYYYEPQRLSFPQDISVKKVSAGYDYTTVIFE